MPTLDLPQRLKLARKMRGFRAAHQLATAAGVSNSAVSNIEAGIRIGPGTLGKLADALRVPLKWLRDGDGPTPDWTVYGKSEPARAYSWRALQIAEIYDAITDPALAAKAYAVMVAFDERGQTELPGEPVLPLPSPAPTQARPRSR